MVTLTILTAAAAILVFIAFGRSRFAVLARNRMGDAQEAAANAIANPVNDGQAELRSAKRDHDSLQSEVAELHALQTQLKIQAKQAESEIVKYEHIAQKAGQAGNATDVRAALSAKNQAQTDLDKVNESIKSNTTLGENLETQLGELATDIETAEHNQVSDSIRIRNAERREGIAKRSASLAKGDERFAGAKALSEAANAAEQRAAAWEETANTAPKAKLASLTEKYGDSASGVTDADVAKYVDKQ